MSAPHPVFEVGMLRAAEFPGVEGGIYLNAASMAPIPERARRAVADLNDRRARIHHLPDADLLEGLRRSREAAARLVGAEVDEIALAPNTSFGINVAAQSLPVEPGGCVVISDREFPANVYPWMGMEGTRLEIVPADALGRPDEARLLERLDRGDVRVFALSSVQFATGHRSDLVRFGRFCRERGIFFVVDAIQSLGQIPLDVREAHIDVLAAGGHKWLCSPFGTGFAYVRRELLERMEPRMLGWTGMQACSDLGSLLDYRWEFRHDARRFEMATLAYHDFAGFAESLSLLLEVGPDRTREHLLYLLDPLVAWLEAEPAVEVVSSLEPAHRSGILAFRPPHPEAVHRALAAAGVVCGLREGAIRLSPHLYNTRAEMERVIEILDRSRAAGWS